MPPRRRKAATGSSAATSAAPVAKKPKTSLSLSWEWEGDGDAWIAFSEDILQEINDNYDNDVMKVEVTINKVKFNILLDKMVQKNSKTGWERRLRCLVKDGSDFYIWQWQDEKNRWNPYAANDTITIETAYQAGEDSVGIVAFQRSYTVDLKKMDQINDVTKVTRTVERLKVDHKPPAAAPKSKTTESNDVESTSAEKSAAKKSQKSKVKVKEEKVDGSGDDVKPSTSKSEAKIKTVVMTGKAPVDSECLSKVGKAHVFWEGNDIYDVMLNQTNLMNNNNKYYIIQLLEDDGKNLYSVWQRWGRVGKAGQNNLVACGSNLDQAKQIFMKKFRDKTLNDWADRRSFSKVKGKYDIVEMDYTAKVDETEIDSKPKDKKTDAPKPESKLDKRIQVLIEMICNVKAMEDTVIEMKYDAKKAPLGKLTDDQITAGLTALKEIEHCIKNNIIGNRLIQACDAYYTRIPHDFGMKRPPVICTEEDLQREIDLLEALGDIQIAMNILKSETGEIENPIDRHYNAMKCKLTAMEKTDPEFKLICDYVKNTHAITHNQYRMEVEDVFVTEKEKEKENFKDYGNRMLLWHGSRLSNYMGILSKGLRIAPPEAPVTGYMFGKGVYFADMSSKSANYCFATKSRNIGLCLLSEVSLGTCNELLNADYKADKLPSGKHSVKGLGRIAPDPSCNHTMADGTIVPLGKGMNTGITNPKGYTLNYNEFIVYDTSQVKMRYLVKMKFHFK